MYMHVRRRSETKQLKTRQASDIRWRQDKLKTNTRQDTHKTRQGKTKSRGRQGKDRGQDNTRHILIIIPCSLILSAYMPKYSTSIMKILRSSMIGITLSCKHERKGREGWG